MLSNDILTAVKAYTEKMAHPIKLVLQTGEHDKRKDLLNFLNQLAGVTDNIQIAQRDANLRSPISFALEVSGQLSGIQFSGIPSGHEFNSLILAILQSGGSHVKLEDSIQSMLSNVEQPLHFEVFVSLSCHNCPDVVQSLNQFSLLNPLISSEMIDGGLFQQVIDERNIQGVPSVYLNGELFANGKIDTAQLVDKLIKRFPHIAQNTQAEQLPLQDVTVIGGGPAGVGAAIYSARKGLKVTMIADRIGGQVKDTVGIENLIATPSTTGTQLTGNLLAHMSDYQITQKEHIRVDKIESDENDDLAPKRLYLSSGEVIESKTVIIATGAKWRKLGIPGEQENIGSGVAYCPHCDGPFFKGKEVAVIGGGNSGIEAALDLAGMVQHVTVFEYLPELKADSVLINKAEANSKITIVKNAQTKEIVAKDGKVVGLEYIDRASGEQQHKALAGVFVQIGLSPNSDFVDGLVDRTQYGEVIVDERCQTSRTGIFAAGDVTTVPYKQIVIAMGEGAKASLSAFDYLMRVA